ncbi:LOW QUALITY PROTEIN: disease resistance protein RPM1-like [Phragmites australis]|uniref:LOW QUALITY PROTEIN: disease resistance protein RPM1-like n=1 Tax=Phragmites australis TaxID=29695 RepID=UPI002D791D84|nr:LOW QUALITY PROTEIN: disease resistance protein RPM1-like [Phragmites australis]
MAEAVVGVLIGKLGAALANGAATYGSSLLSKESSALNGLFGQIRKAEGELGIMKAYLRDSEKFKDTDETTGIFIKKIRDLAFRIEDVVDEFTFKLEDDKHGGFTAKMMKRIKHVKIWRRLAHELSDINAELEDVAKKRGLYAMPVMERYAGGSNGHNATNTSNFLFCAGKRFILVLDDVWEKDVWINIKDVFPSPSKCIGRVVLTSRKYEVASLATSNCVIELQQMGENHSWKLFCNLAFWNNDDKRCPPELQDLAAKFLQKCEGLPLAIACIGRLLSCKPPSYSEWKNVYEELELHSAKNVIPGVDIILKVSLEDLPYELKNCFLHCAMFPEDYGMKRRLIKHWITAGFIKGEENKTLEEVAEGCLNGLVNRSLLQVVQKNEFGRVKCCRMHDVIRHLALDKAEKECFGKVYDGSRTFSADGTRRLSIQSTNIVPLSQSGATRLRAIHAFTSYVDIDLLRPILARSNFLSTLDLQGTRIKILPKEVFNLFNLRFLGLRYTGIEILPEAIGRLRNLEVLDAFDTALVPLPKSVAKLKNLRFLYACSLVKHGAYQQFGGVMVPRGIRNLTGLHALQDIKATVETLFDVAALKELRTFSVSDVTSEHSLNLCSAIMNMSHLVHLSITASNENEVLPLEALRLPGTLYKLGLTGQLEKKGMPQIVSSWSHHNNLTRLYLKFSKLDEDSFSSLVVLRGLCNLTIVKAYDGKKLYFSALSFPKLRQLRIWGASQLNQVEIEEGALGSLVELVFNDCPELKRLPRGIEYLTGLEKLYLIDTGEELIEKLTRESEAIEFNEERMKISHIRWVIVEYIEKNIRETISREKA